MGWKLNSRGDLTVSQRKHADALGISHAKFKEHILERYKEEMEKILPPTNRNPGIKKNFIESNNPVLITGAGPSTNKNIEEIKKFPGIVLVMDINYNELSKHGVIPDYVMTLESASTSVRPEMFLSKYLVQNKNKTTVVGSSITHHGIEEYLRKHGSFQRWSFEGEPRCSNVGAFALNFAKLYLKADKIFLVGFEHKGTKYSQANYYIWQIDFWHFVKQWPKETIVNCCDGGTLYYEDYIVDTTLDKLKIIKND